MVGQWGSLISEARVPPNISLVEFSVVRDLDMARDVASSKTASGQEGISIKDPDAGYTLGDDGTWLELKGEVEEEFKVVDVVWKVKQPMLKVVLDDTTVVLVGNLDEVEQTNVWTPPPSMRLVKDVHGKWRNPDGSKPDAHLLSKGSPNPEVIGRWARVRYHHRTKYGSLANPRFAGFRNESGGVS
jgi:ATP-dependent DNA ligase